MGLKLPKLVAQTERIDREVRRSQSEAKFISRPRAGAPDRLAEFVPWASPDLDAPDHLEPLCVELQRVMRGERIEVCVSVPPRHGKSTTVHHFVAMLLLADQRKRVLYASYDVDFAAHNLAEIRKIVLALGIPLGAVDRKEEFTLAGGGGVMACGIQAPPTGLGFDLVIVDDPIRRLADALSRAIRERIGKGFVADLYSRKVPGSKKRPTRRTSYVVVATRWHEDDLTGRLAAKGWRVINLPAIKADGTALAPVMFPLEELARIRAMNEYVWHSLYMGDPAPRTGRMFGDVHFVKREAMPETYRAVFGVDIARKADQRNDRQALLELRESKGCFYVADFFADRMPLTDHVKDGRVVARGFTSVLADRMRGRPGVRAVQYTGGDEDLVLDLLSKQVANRVHVEAMRATSDKRFRANGVASAWNAGTVLLLEDAPWVDDFAAHVVSFTGADGAEDEEVDCLAAAYDALTEGESRVHQPATSTKHLRLGIGIRKRWT